MGYIVFTLKYVQDDQNIVLVQKEVKYFKKLLKTLFPMGVLCMSFNQYMKKS